MYDSARIMDILGTRIDNFFKEEILAKVESFLQEEKFHQIATINPEFIIEAQKNEGFKNILNGCDLNVADGVGIWFSYLRFGKILKSKMAGADLMEEILKIAERNNHKVFLVAGRNTLSSWEETRIAILKKYPNLEITGSEIYNFEFRISNEIITSNDLISEKFKNSTLEHSKLIQNSELEINNSEVVFCSLGAPLQEKFLHSLKTSENAKIRLAMGVGGSFDFWTGKKKRAPKIMQKIGMEWLWRFLQEPKYRAKRIWKAVIIFPIKVLFNF